jgi:hypothetical protein
MIIVSCNTVDNTIMGTLGYASHTQKKKNEHKIFCTIKALLGDYRLDICLYSPDDALIL